MTNPEMKMGLDRETFSSYVEALPKKDQQIKSVEMVNISDTIIAYKVDVEQRLGSHHKNLSFNLTLFEKDGLEMGIYHPLMGILPGSDFGEKIAELNNWWRKKSPESNFNVGESADHYLTVIAHGPAAHFPTEQTEWISELIDMSNLVSAKLRADFPKPE